MGKRKYILMMIGMLLPVAMSAQRKEISQAKQWIKQGNNLEKAEESMKKLLTDSVHRDNERIWLTLFDAIRKQYEQGNEKLYLKQQYDTTRLFVLTKKMFEVLEQFDSVDAKPNKKGKIELEYRQSHAEYLHQFRQNLFNGGAFYMYKQQFKEAISMYDAYIQSAYQPLFEQYRYQQTDKRLSEAAYWAAYNAFKIQDYASLLRYSSLALTDTTYRSYMLQYLAETYKAINQPDKYEKILVEGFQDYPTASYFFPHLVDYYVQNKQFDTALSIINTALANDSVSSLYLFAKSSVLLNTGQYDECIGICNQIIAADSALLDPYLNAGLAYFNKAVVMDKEIHLSHKDRKQIKNYYHKALPYLEHYKALAPDMQEKWALPLYTIYLNLNMGKKFDEMDKLINNPK